MACIVGGCPLKAIGAGFRRTNDTASLQSLLSHHTWGKSSCFPFPHYYTPGGSPEPPASVGQ